MPAPKFQNVSFSALPVWPLNTDNPPDDRGFRCSRGEFVTYWRQGRIAREVRSSVAKAWYLQHSEGFVGYITLLTDKLTVGAGEQILSAEGIQYGSFPAIKIGLLAVDERAKGAGSRLVEWALAYIATVLWSRVGIRFITVDALRDPDTGYDTSGYYRKFGFRAVNQRDVSPNEGFRTMYVDVLPFVKTLTDIPHGPFE